MGKQTSICKDPEMPVSSHMIWPENELTLYTGMGVVTEKTLSRHLLGESKLGS